MFSLSESLNYYLYRFPTDMRKSFDALSGLVLDKIKRNPQSGEVYIFVNKNRNLMKLLNWQEGGFVLYYKRLEKGTFQLPKIQDISNEIRLSQTELILIIRGISMENIRQKKRYKS
jgi:transposase